MFMLRAEWIFCEAHFLLPLRQLILRQKQPGHWAVVVCHFYQNHRLAIAQYHKTPLSRGCLPFLPKPSTSNAMISNRKII